MLAPPLGAEDDGCAICTYFGGGLSAARTRRSSTCDEHVVPDFARQTQSTTRAIEVSMRHATTLHDGRNSERNIPTRILSFIRSEVEIVVSNGGLCAVATQNNESHEHCCSRSYGDIAQSRLSSQIAYYVHDSAPDRQNTAFRLRPVNLESRGTSSFPRRRYSCDDDLSRRYDAVSREWADLFLAQNPVLAFDTFPLVVLLPLALSLP